MSPNVQDAVSLQVSLPQMLDLALGTPEVGAFNFNLLHNFLHVLLHQIDLKNTKVEYRGDNANRIKTMVSSSKSGPSVQLHEYSITDGAGSTTQREENTGSVDVVTADNNSQVKTSKGLKNQIGPRANSKHESVIFVEPMMDGVTPTGLAFKQLDDSVKRLQQQFQALEEFATTPEMVERLRTSRTDPLSDMWHVININKRLDASEQGIDKAMTMLQDLIKGDKIEIVGSEKSPEDVQLLNDRVTELEMNLVYLNDDLKNLKDSQATRRVSVKGSSPVAVKSEHKVPTTTNSKSKRELSQTSFKSGTKSQTAVASDNEESSSPKIPKTEPASPPADDSVSSENIKKELSKTSAVSGSVVQPKVEQEEEEEEEQIAKSPSQQMTRSRTTITRRGSVIGGVDLNELQADVKALKAEMKQAKADVSSLKGEVGKTKQDALKACSEVEQLSKALGSFDVPMKNSINTKNPSLHDPQSPHTSSTIETSKIVKASHTENGIVEENNPRQNTFANATPNDSIGSPVGTTLVDINQAGQTSNKSSTPSALGTQNSSGYKPSAPKLIGNHSNIVQDKKNQLTGAQNLFGNLPGDEGQKIELMEAIRNMEIMYGEAMQNLDSRVGALENSIKDVNEKICNLENGLQCTGGGDGIQEIQELVTVIQGIQGDIDKINQTAARLCQEKEDRDLHTQALGEQIELLKTVKADKEELEDALADKADARTVNRKVSCDKFDTTCEDLTRCLDDTIAKLTHQEYIWQQALESVQQEIEGKLDKIEISPIKDFVNNRLKVLQDKLKMLFDRRRETEAAGTKKMLTDVQCISCDKKVMMKVAESVNYRSDPMPCSRNIKPYLTYELNQVRNQQRKLPGRSGIQFSPATPPSGRILKPEKDDWIDKTSRDNLCNRYCGGSHTVTSPHQRIMRMGHFLAQWGPEAIQLGENIVQGSDGQLYKGRAIPPGAVAKKPDPCDPCNCNTTDAQVKKTSSPVSRQSSDVIAAAPPKTSQISHGKTASTIQSSRRQSTGKAIRSTQSLQREAKSPSHGSITRTIKEGEMEEKISPNQSRRASIPKIEEEEQEEEDNEMNYENME